MPLATRSCEVKIKKRNLFGTKTLESVKSEFKYSDRLMSKERAVLSRTQYLEVSLEKIRGLWWRARWSEVNDREMDQLREDKESVYSIWRDSITLEEYKGKVMRDIMEEGRLCEYRVQGFQGLYREISAISRSCMNTRHFWELVKAVKESYFENINEGYFEGDKYKEHSMGPNHHEGKRKSYILSGSIKDLSVSKKRVKTDKPVGKDDRNSHRKLIEKYKGIKDR